MSTPRVATHNAPAMELFRSRSFRGLLGLFSLFGAIVGDLTYYGLTGAHSAWATGLGSIAPWLACAVASHARRSDSR